MMLEQTVYVILKTIFFILLMICVLMIEVLVYVETFESERKSSRVIVDERIIENNKEEKYQIQELQIADKINDWRLILVNTENLLPENYEVKLANLDEKRQFDERAIGELMRYVARSENCGSFKYMDTISISKSRISRRTI